VKLLLLLGGKTSGKGKGKPVGSSTGKPKKGGGTAVLTGG